MKRFLEEVAEDLTNKSLPNKSWVIISPNHRVGLFIQKIWAKNLKQPIWSPELWSMDDLVSTLTGQSATDKLYLLNWLYEAWQTHLPSEETFDQFFFWGDMLLSDFDELDRNQIAIDKIFTELKAVKDLEARFSDYKEVYEQELKDFLSVFSQNQSRLKDNFVQVWNKLYPIYLSFQEILNDKKAAYKGKLYREASAVKAFDFIKNKQVAVVGFNRLDPCEKEILLQLKQHPEVYFYWNEDQGLLERAHASMHFIAENKNDLADGVSISKSQLLVNKPKLLQIAASGISGQISSTIDAIPKEIQGPFDMGIILNDEQFLLPLLRMLPKELSEVNVSLGLGLKDTPAFTFIDRVDKFCLLVTNDINISVEELIQLKKHIWLIDYVQLEEDAAPWYTIDELSNNQLIAAELMAVLTADNLDSFLSNGIQFIEKLYNDYKNNSYQQAIVEQLYSSLKKFEEFVQLHQRKLSISGAIKMIKQIIRATKVPFNGQPLSGLQILGPLEARNLDFDQVLHLGMNEGKTPGSPKHSFIPMGLKLAYGLPTPQEKQWEEHSYFINSLQRTQQATFTYNSELGQTGGGEISRFLQDLDLILTDLQLDKNVLGAEINTEILLQDKGIAVDSGLRKKVLEKLTTKGISPSALKNYNQCPLKFLLQNVLTISNYEETTDPTDARVFGNIVHGVLEQFYSRKKEWNAQDIENLKTEVPKEVRRQTLKETRIKKDSELNSGAFIMLCNAAIETVQRFLALDKENAPFKIVGLEKNIEEYNLQYDLHENGEKFAVRFKGIIDRIDRKDGFLRVLDYKTGKETRKIGKGIRGLFSLNGLEKKDLGLNNSVFQVLLYAYLLSESESFSAENIRAGLISIRDESAISGFNNWKIYEQENRSKPKELDKDWRKEFKVNLDALLLEIKNRDFFCKTPVLSNCTYCEFQSICDRN